MNHDQYARKPGQSEGKESLVVHGVGQETVRWFGENGASLLERDSVLLLVGHRFGSVLLEVSVLHLGHDPWRLPARNAFRRYQQSFGQANGREAGCEARWQGPVRGRCATMHPWDGGQSRWPCLRSGDRTDAAAGKPATAC